MRRVRLDEMRRAVPVARRERRARSRQSGPCLAWLCLAVAGMGSVAAVIDGLGLRPRKPSPGQPGLRSSLAEPDLGQVLGQVLGQILANSAVAHASLKR